MNESGLWNRIRKANPNIFLKRIESVADAGVPDVTFASYPNCGWIELKYFEPKPSLSYRLTLKDYTTAQRRFHRDFVRAGGIVWLAVGVGSQTFWLMGKKAITINQFKIGELSDWSFYQGNVLPWWDTKNDKINRGAL